jgi:hypothetical protein
MKVPENKKTDFKKMFKYIVFNREHLEINLKCYFFFLECDICYCVALIAKLSLFNN